MDNNHNEAHVWRVLLYICVAGLDSRSDAYTLLHIVNTFAYSGVRQLVHRR